MINVDTVPRIVLPTRDGQYKFLQLHVKHIGQNAHFMRFGRGREETFSAGRLVQETLEELEIEACNTFRDSKNFIIPGSIGADYQLVSVGRCRLSTTMGRDTYTFSLEPDQDYILPCLDLYHLTNIEPNPLLSSIGTRIEIVRKF